MNFRQLTASGDFTFGAGLANYATGQQAIELNLSTGIKMWAGDFFGSLNGWINWKALLQVGQQNNLNASLQTFISQSYGVSAINSASVVVNPTTRNAFAVYDIFTVYSTQVVNNIQILSGQPGNN